MSSKVATVKSASDVMSQGIVSVEANDSIQEAMQIMTEHHVSGVPVVDEQNHCIGVISTSDVVSFIEADQEALEGEVARTENWFNPESQKWEESIFSHEMLGEYDLVPVSDAMTRDPLTVGPAMPVVAVAQAMMEHGIHRVFVVDDNQHLQGVISALDFVQLVAEG